MKPFHVVGEDALIRMIETDHHSVAVVIHAKNIAVQR